LEEAIAVHRGCLEARRRSLGVRHRDTLISQCNLAHSLWGNAENAEALRLYQDAFGAIRDVGSETELAIFASNLGNCLYAANQLEEEDRMLEASLERAASRLGPEHQDTDRLRWAQIRVWIDLGRVVRAVALGRQAMVCRRRIYPPGNRMIAEAEMDLGRALVLLGQFTEAEAMLASSLAIFAQTSPNLAHYPVWSECWLGTSLVGQRRHDEAERHLLNAEKGLHAARTTPRRHYRQCVESLIKLYESWDKHHEAARWQAELTALDQP
jgi:tetratricopeptide (TPR) repeat protein